MDCIKVFLGFKVTTAVANGSKLESNDCDPLRRNGANHGIHGIHGKAKPRLGLFGGWTNVCEEKQKQTGPGFREP